MKTTIDVLFAIDILVAFNTALDDVEDEIIEDRKSIAIHYLKGWFTIDVIAIVPFDQLLSTNDFGSSARLLRIGRLYKLAKLLKLFRILKIMKEKYKLLKQIHEILKIGAGFERLFFFIIVFFLCVHIGACLWLIFASLE